MLARSPQVSEIPISFDKKEAQSDMAVQDVTFDLSQMSLSARARLSLLVEKDGDESLRSAMLGSLGASGGRLRRSEREVPDSWNQIHVLNRLEEAFRILSYTPGAGRRSSTVWPAMQAQKLAILDMIELMGTGELEAREEAQNRVRLAPTTAEISRMEEALGWPFQFLRAEPSLAQAIQLRAMWAAMGANIRKRCERRKLSHDQFNLDWQRALALITGTLIAGRAPVR